MFKEFNKIIEEDLKHWADVINNFPFMVSKPEKIIFNNPTTIIKWNDGSKTIVKCENDEFSEEFGVAMAFMRKIYGSRGEFKRMIKRLGKTQNKLK